MVQNAGNKVEESRENSEVACGNNELMEAWKLRIER